MKKTKRVDILIKLSRGIAVVIGASIFWSLLVYGSCKGVEHYRSWMHAPMPSSEYDEEIARRHDGLLRRSVGRDYTNWAPNGGR